MDRHPKRPQRPEAPPGLRRLERLAGRVLRLVRAARAEADIFILPGREMASLKRRFFKKFSEPNVLSFRNPEGFPHPETKKRPLGEIYLNRDILRKEPARAAPLLIHGILHLLGHDHEKSAEAARMEGLERRLLRRVRAASGRGRPRPSVRKR